MTSSSDKLVCSSAEDPEMEDIKDVGAGLLSWSTTGTQGNSCTNLTILATTGALVILCVAAFCKFWGSGPHEQTATKDYFELSSVRYHSCPIRPEFCNDTLSYRDCDGDGVLDPYCEGEQLLRFGYLSSANNCTSNWPNGLCMQENEKKRAAGTFTTAASNEITIIHFNDVYEVAGVLDNDVRRGGMSRAAHVIQQERDRNPNRTFVVFAGDLLSPSVLSELFYGAQMINILNYLHLDAASLGNHEFDFGVDVLETRIYESNFKWLNTNLMDESGRLLPGTTPRFIRDVPFAPRWSTGHDVKQTRVCMFGASFDVRKTMIRDRTRIRHVDAINASLKESRHLRESEGCNVVLALTHQFSHFDCKMSSLLGKSVDLILGGHDHSTELNTACGHAPYVKADSDLKTQWVMTLWLADDGSVDSVDGRLISLTDVDPFNRTIHDRVLHWEKRGEMALGEIIGCTTEDLDAIGTHVRQQETNLGNFFVDAVQDVHHTDVVLINGGAIRGNNIVRAGNLTKMRVVALHPFGNTVVKIHTSGEQIRQYLDNQLDCYADICGSFVQVAGLRYAFDPSLPADHRVKHLTYLNGTHIPEKENLTVAMTNYMLENSVLKQNKLYNMVTINDGLPLVTALLQAVEKAGSQCISPRLEGRITKLR